MKRIFCFLLIFGSNFNIFGDVQKMDGNRLLQVCNDAVELFENKQLYPSVVQISNMGECIGYLEATTDVNNYVQDVNTFNESIKKPYYCIITNPLKFTRFNFKLFMPFSMSCPLPGITFIQEAKIIVKYLNNHPEKLNESGIYITSTAMQEVFPCS